MSYLQDLPTKIIIDPNGVALPQTQALQFTGPNVTVTDSYGRTIVNITPGDESDPYLETFVTATLTADQVYWEPAGWTDCTVLRIQTDNAYAVTNFGLANKKRKTVINVGPGTVTLTGNILTSPNGFTMVAHDAVDLLFDPVSNKWRTV